MTRAISEYRADNDLCNNGARIGGIPAPDATITPRARQILLGTVRASFLVQFNIDFHFLNQAAEPL